MEKDAELKAIAQQLVEMEEEDQRLQKEEKWEEFRSLAKDNIEKIKRLVGKIGWPLISKVGEDGSHAAWIIVQHADQYPDPDIDFQEECLSLMEALPEGEVKKKQVAYLTDRVRTNRGLPQVYGTQFWTDEDGRYGPRPIENSAEVDQRRAEVGLGPLEEYRKIMEDFNSGKLKIGQFD